MYESRKMLNYGFVKTAAATPKLRVADTVYNTGMICDMVTEAADLGVKIIVFPELL